MIKVNGPWELNWTVQMTETGPSIFARPSTLDLTHKNKYIKNNFGNKYILLSYWAKMLDTFLNTKPEAQSAFESQFFKPQNFKPGSLRLVFKFYLKMLFNIYPYFLSNLKSLNSLSTTSLSKHQLCKYHSAPFLQTPIFTSSNSRWHCDNQFQ